MGNEGYPMGFVVGLTCGILLFGGYTKTIKKEVEVPMQPTAIIQEYRNDDRLLDIVQKYQDGSEIVLYAHRNEQGNIEYRLQE